MTLQVSTSIPNGALTTPVPLTPAASDTIAAGSFGPNGCLIRVITTGTATNVSITDPNLTLLGNAGTSASLACPATGARMLPIPVGAINQATQLATVTFSGALTGVTYELYRY
jgi:hypothetical protein